MNPPIQPTARPLRQHSCVIRDIDPASDAEIEQVAVNMRRTLIEVEGEEAGTALYTMDWLRERVRWHLDPDQCIARVFVAEDKEGRIVGDSIMRVEFADNGGKYGLFSTTYVEPTARKRALASDLLVHGETWMLSHDLHEAATWTSATNKKLISLYRKHGYLITARHTHEVTKTPMVRLTKSLFAAGQATPTYL